MFSSASPCQSSAMSILYNAQEARDRCCADVQIIHTRTSLSHGVSQLLQNPRCSKARCSKPASLALLWFMVSGSFAHSACAQSILIVMTTPKAASFRNTPWLPIPTHRRLQFIDFAMSCHPEETGTLEWSRRNDTHLKPSISSPSLSASYAGSHFGDA